MSNRDRNFLFAEALVYLDHARALVAGLQRSEDLPEGPEGVEGEPYLPGTVSWRIALINGEDVCESAFFDGLRFNSRDRAQLALDTCGLSNTDYYLVELVEDK